MYLDKIFKILNNELDLVTNDCGNNKELLYELGLLKAESNNIYNKLVQMNYKIVLNNKYKEVYEKILKTTEYIKSRNDNSVMIDYLNEIYTNIFDYSKTIAEYISIKEKYNEN